MTGEPKTGDRLLELVLDDISYMKTRYGVELIAWCTDDGPDGKKMRRLLGAMLLWIIIIVCWAHQINLIVGDFLGLKEPYLKCIKEGLEIIKWFNAHSAALALLNKEQRFTYEGKWWALILPVITRWTTHYLSVSQLLKVKSAVRSCSLRHKETLLTCAGKEAKLKLAARAILDTVANDVFWGNLAKLVNIYRD